MCHPPIMCKRHPPSAPQLFFILCALHTCCLVCRGVGSPAHVHRSVCCSRGSATARSVLLCVGSTNGSHPCVWSLSYGASNAITRLDRVCAIALVAPFQPSDGVVHVNSPHLPARDHHSCRNFQHGGLATANAPPAPAFGVMTLH